MAPSPRFIYLHLACIVRRPRTWRFHADGILREVWKAELQLRPALLSFAHLL